MITSKQKNIASVQDAIWSDHIWLPGDTVSFHQCLVFFAFDHVLTMACVAPTDCFVFSKTSVSWKCDLALFWSESQSSMVHPRYYSIQAVNIQFYLLQSEQQIRETEQHRSDKSRYTVLQLSFSEWNSFHHNLSYSNLRPEGSYDIH